MSDCWILTRTGKRFDLLEPTPDMVDVEDICSALANLCRFTGHTRSHYSVAEHSIIGASYLPKELQLEFLLHDAHEAYVGDLNKPLKKVCPEYQKIESRIDQVIREKFGLPPTITPEVKQMDLIMLATELRDLMPDCSTTFPCLEGVHPLGDQILTNKPDSDWGLKQEKLNIQDQMQRLICERFPSGSQLQIRHIRKRLTRPVKLVSHQGI